MKLLCWALSCAFIASNASAAVFPAAQTAYQEGAAGSSCNGQTSCTITFPTIAASTLATIEHVSCNSTLGNYDAVYLTALYAKSSPSVVDSFEAPSYLQTGTNGDSITSAQTIFFVKASDAPVITL